MSAFEFGFNLGIMYGFALGATIEEQRRNLDKMAKPKVGDDLLLNYLFNKGRVYMDDLISYMNYPDTKGDRVSVGAAMKRLGWLRGRDRDRRWYYERGPKAIEIAERIRAEYR